MMNKTNMTLLLAFVAVFGAGAVIGTARHSVQNETETRRGSWLKRELELTDQQHEQMRAIWSDVMSGGDKQPQQGRNSLWEKRREFQKERDQAVINMLTPEQRQQYDKLNVEYEQKIAELSEARKKAIQEAIDRTKQILTPEQVAKYDQFLKRRGRGGAPRPFGNGSSTTQPTETTADPG